MQVDTEAVRRAAQAKLEAAQAEFDAVIRSIAAIELLARSGPEAGGIPSSASGTSDFVPSRHRIWDGLRSAIRLTLDEKPQGISIVDVEEFIRRTYPGFPAPTRRTISLAMSKMKRRTKELETLRGATGTTPAIYRRASTNDTKSEQATQS